MEKTKKVEKKRKCDVMIELVKPTTICILALFFKMFELIETQTISKWNSFKEIFLEKIHEMDDFYECIFQDRIFELVHSYLEKTE